MIFKLSLVFFGFLVFIFSAVSQSTGNEEDNFTVKTIASFGDGDGQFNIPHSLVFDEEGNIYITDTNNNRVQKFSSDGKFIAKWGSNGTGDGQFSNHAHGVAIDSLDRVYVTDRFNHNIQKFDSDGRFLTKWGSKGSGNGQFDEPHSSAIDSTGNVYVSDMNNRRIQKFSPDGKFIAKWGSKGTGEGQFLLPFGLDFDSHNNIHVLDRSSGRVQEFFNNGSFISQTLINSTDVKGSTSILEDIELDKFDKEYLTDRANHDIIVILKE